MRREAGGRAAPAVSAQDQKGDLERVRQPDGDEHRVHDSVEPASQGLELWPKEELTQEESDEQEG